MANRVIKNSNNMRLLVQKKNEIWMKRCLNHFYNYSKLEVCDSAHGKHCRESVFWQTTGQIHWRRDVGDVMQWISRSDETKKKFRETEGGEVSSNNNNKWLSWLIFHKYIFELKIKTAPPGSNSVYRQNLAEITL